MVWHLFNSPAADAYSQINWRLFFILVNSMNFFKKLFFPPKRPGTYYLFSVQCKRCGETIRGQVNLSNEPSLDFSAAGKPGYTCRKVLIGNGHCFQQIEVVIRFNEDHHVLEREINGGTFVEISN
jgi:hypothetical protein